MAGARIAGEWCGFRWFQARDVSLGALLQAIPEFVFDRIVLVSACDSGPLRLTPHELSDGWRQSERLALSPKSPAPWAIPQGQWDEWYIFEGEPSPRSPEVF